MLLATHALTGAIIGKNIASSWLVIIFSLILHYVLDIFRHGEYLNRNSRWIEFWKVLADLAVGSSILALVIYFLNPPAAVTKNMLIGALFSMFPDFFSLMYFKFNVGFLKKLFDFHVWIHRYPPLSPEREWNLRNAFNDIIVSITAIILLIV
ncbi:MAG: hypothetical protein NT136_02155 [Candidatus Moranbacteria bacterium]|nr:hypothetical protein [Candidatus Moranbacteria bacterium]